MKRFLTALAALVAASVIAAASVPLVPSTPQYNEPSQIVATLNYLVGLINTNVTPQTMAPNNNARNLLDNGDITVTQRGTAAATCGTTSGPGLTAYSADRWACDVNVTSGAGQLSVTTSTPTPPTGFTNQLQLVRNSGALAQPQCIWQEVPTSESVTLQGQQVVLSAYMAALGGLNADNGNAANLVIITGTGTNQGLGTGRSAVGMTASPAITPVWTGLATLINTPITLTTTYARYSTSALVPTTVKEIAVGLCFTPTTTSSGGSTDGFVATGIQLEVGSAPSAYEFRPRLVTQQKTQAFYQRIAELAATYPVAGFCQATGANTNSCTIDTAVTFDATPTITITTAGTFKVNIAGSLTTIASPAAGNCGLNACIVTAANTNTAGQVEQLTGAAGGTGVWEISADF